MLPNRCTNLAKVLPILAGIVGVSGLALQAATHHGNGSRSGHSGGHSGSGHAASGGAHHAGSGGGGHAATGHGGTASGHHAATPTATDRASHSGATTSHASGFRHPTAVNHAPAPIVSFDSSRVVNSVGRGHSTSHPIHVSTPPVVARVAVARHVAVHRNTHFDSSPSGSVHRGGGPTSGHSRAGASAHHFDSGHRQHHPVVPRIQPARHHHDAFPFFFTGFGAGYGWNSASYYRPYYNYPYNNYPYYDDSYYADSYYYPPATSLPAPAVPLDFPLPMEPSATPQGEPLTPLPDSETIDDSLVRRLLAPKKFPAREAPEVLPDEPVASPSTTPAVQPGAPRETPTQ